MSGPPIRAGLAIVVIGLLFIWLIRPIGNPCPDVDKLPSGSSGSSAPSFAPPLTRICTYSTPDGTQARQRYVPLLDLVALVFVAGLGGGAISLAGHGRRAPPRRPRSAAPPRPPRPKREPNEAHAPPPPPAADEQTRHERDEAQRERAAAARERARQEREARRRA
jgi:hypothetical protein